MEFFLTKTRTKLFPEWDRTQPFCFTRYMWNDLRLSVLAVHLDPAPLGLACAAAAARFLATVAVAGGRLDLLHWSTLIRNVVPSWLLLHALNVSCKKKTEPIPSPSIIFFISVETFIFPSEKHICKGLLTHFEASFGCWNKIRFIRFPKQTETLRLQGLNQYFSSRGTY